MTDKEMLNDMLAMQEEYDKLVFAAHGLDGYESISDEQMQSALLDEIGELNHELKGDWCWWKKTQKPVDRRKVLEEFVDVVHFLLMESLWYRKDCEDDDWYRKDYEDDDWSERTFVERFESEKSKAGYEPVKIMLSLLSGNVPYLRGYLMHCLAKSLGFTWTEVYEAYKAKNLVNRQRIRDGY